MELLGFSDVGVVLLLFAVALLTKWFIQQHRVDWPPGPWAWPIIGNSRSIITHPCAAELFCKWAEKYGELYSISYGPYPTIVLNSYDVIKEALVDKSDCFSTRPNWLYTIRKSNAFNGIIWGHNWQMLRRFALSSLKGLGLGKSSIEERIREECSELIHELLKYTDKPVDPKEIISKAVSNIICGVVYGSRLDYENEEFKRVIHAMNEAFKTAGLPNPMNQLSWLRFVTFLLPGNAKRFQRLKEYEIILKQFVKSRIDEHRSTFDPSNIRDYVDLCIASVEKNDEKAQGSGMSNMFFSILDLFAAGTETTTTTLLWGLLYMILNPDIQQKCRNEIHGKIGRGRLPHMYDRTGLPYTEATLLEIQRMGSIGASALLHSTAADTTLKGYKIPKDTIVIVNLYSTMMDPNIWKNPESFDPDRWLGSNGEVLNVPQFIPFSLGKRKCLGDNLAQAEMFLFFTSLLQELEFSMVDGSNQPSTKAEQGVTRNPVPFSLYMKAAA